MMKYENGGEVDPDSPEFKEYLEYSNERKNTDNRFTLMNIRGSSFHPRNSDR